MEETDKNETKHSTIIKSRKSLAVTSFILGIVPLILIILKNSYLLSDALLEMVAIFIVLFAPIFAVIYGIIALTEKENRFLALTGIILGIFTFLLFFYFFPIGPKTSHTARTMAILSQLRPGISICCSVFTNQLQATADSDICDPPLNAMLPEHSDLLLPNKEDLSYNVTAQCNTDLPEITVTIKNHPNKNCNGEWVVNEIKMTPPPGCF